MFLLALLILFQDESQVTDDWVIVEPPRIGAKFKMPSRPEFSEQAIKPVEDRAEIVVRSRLVTSPDGKSSFTFVYHDEPQKPRSRTKVNAVLDGAITGAIALVNGDLVTQSEIFVKNNKGRDFVYKCELEDLKYQKTLNLRIRSRILLVGSRLYSMNYIAEAESYDNKLAESYFDSFELVSKPGDLPPKPRPGRARELSEKK